MPGTKRPRPLLLFYILVVYVLLQFGWWAFLLVRLQKQVNECRTELALSENISADSYSIKAGFESKMHKDLLMVIGEGSVFLVLLLLGIARTRNSFRKEAELNARQKNFILSVTHELRSPLASIRLQLETLQHRELSREKQNEIQSNAIEDIDRLNNLVENILVAARLDHHVYNLKKENGNLSDTIGTICNRMQLLLKKGQHLEKKIAVDIQTGFDGMAFNSILSNLIENASKYAPENSGITVAAEKKQEEYVVSVSDRGPGINAAERSKIFDRFYRTGSEEIRSAKGTGLGLYIVKQLVEAHGWTILVGDNPGGGSTFEIRIPCT